MAEEIDNVADAEPVEATTAPDARASKAPIFITLAALLLYFAFQSLQMVLERGNLGMVKANQESAIQEAQKIQTQFKTLITKTSELAKQGHAGAKMILEGLQSQGLGVAPDTNEVLPETKAPSKPAPGPAK
jgi:hypothetical protein